MSQVAGTGQLWDAAKDSQRSFEMYETLLSTYPTHPEAVEAEASLLQNFSTCAEISSLKSNPAIVQRQDFIPSLYSFCGKAYENQKDWSNAIIMYEALLSEYPTHPEAVEAEASLLQNFSTCAEISSLKSNPAIAQRQDFIPSLYSFCGKAYENQKDWSNAIIMYDNLLAEYPDYALTAGAEAALARSIVAQASEEGGGVIPPPEKSGNTSTGETEVTIQNDSPEELRIVFSGPEFSGRKAYFMWFMSKVYGSRTRVLPHTRTDRELHTPAWRVRCSCRIIER